MIIYPKNGPSLYKMAAYVNKTVAGIRNVRSLTNIIPAVLIISLLFAFSSCEEEDLPQDETQSTALQSFAGENNSLQVIGSDELSILPGELPYLSTGEDN